MSETAAITPLRLRDRIFTDADIEQIRRLISANPDLGRTQLSYRICDMFSWHQANGRLKDRACRVALLRLETLGLIRLPKRQVDTGGRPPRIHKIEKETHLDIAIDQMPKTLELHRVDEYNQAKLWNAVVGNYHYLGLSVPVGRMIRYLIYGDATLLGAISFTECAWKIKARSEALSAIGLSPATSRQIVIANNRFLLLPQVNVQNLASRALSLATRTIPGDWSARFGVQPIIAETFVDTTRFPGTSYRASNWVPVGFSKGYAKRGSQHKNGQIPKLLLLRGLTPSTHVKLLQLRDRRNVRS